MEKRYMTRSIDYAGCDNFIAKSLRRGESVLCDMEDGTAKLYVIGYVAGSPFPYTTEGREEHTVDGLSEHWEKAVPIEQQQYVKEASEIVKWFEDNGWKPYENAWSCDDSNCVFYHHEFRYCGKPLPDGVSMCEEWLEWK